MSELAAAGWLEHTFEMQSFTLENGETLAPLTLSYATLGARALNGSNAIVLLPSANSVKQWALRHVGKNSTIDPAKYFVVTIDAIGGGASSRPSERHAAHFPGYGIRDNARAVHALLTQALGLSNIKAIGGASMGAMIALEFGLCFPAFASGLFLWSPASHCSSMFAALARLVRTVLELDPTFENGNYSAPPSNGLFAAGMAYFLALVGRRYLDRVPSEERVAVSQLVGRAFAEQWDANDLLSRYASLTRHDVRNRPSGREDDILTRLKSACLLMPSRSDHLLPIEDVQQMHREITNSRLKVINGDLGHWAASQPIGTAEYRRVQTATREFLNDL